MSQVLMDVENLPDVQVTLSSFSNAECSIFDAFKSDAIQINGSRCEVLDCLIVDKAGQYCEVTGAKPHRDAIQLIPKELGQNWMNFAGADMSDITIDNNVIDGTGTQLQGIFAVDGRFFNLAITNNRIVTDSQHKIVIAGLMSGQVLNNRELGSGELIIPQFDPLRLCGGLNVRVRTFMDAEYLPIETDGEVRDYRLLIVAEAKGKFQCSTMLDDFDMAGFKVEVRTLQANNVNEFVRLAEPIALRCGKCVPDVFVSMQV